MKLVETFQYLADELFTIRFQHSGFNASLNRSLSEAVRIEADEETRTFFQSFSIGSAFYQNSFVCFIRSRLLSPPAPQPRAAYLFPVGEKRLRFFLTGGSRFQNLTLLPPTATGQYYSFSNRTNVGSGLFITHDAGGVNASDIRPLSDVNLRSQPLAVIDIFTSGAANGSYELFTGTSGELRSPVYQVRFHSLI